MNPPEAMIPRIVGEPPGIGKQGWTTRHSTSSTTSADFTGRIATAIVVVVLVRLAILFPAIAVDAPGASLRNVMADTKARSWLILKSFFIVLLPVLAGLLAVGLISELDDLPNWWSAARIAFDSPLELLATVLAAATASRLYGWIGHQVKGVPI